MNKPLLALAFGAFGFSASQYTMMGILSAVADCLHISAAHAGHFLSSYAIGVVGGSLLAGIFGGGKLKPKKFILALLALFTIANLLTSAAENYWQLLLICFIAGLPQGGFFAVASLVSEKISERGKEAQAMALMFAGMTVAIIIAVPAATFISHTFSWRIPYIAIGLSGIMAWLLTLKWMPDIQPSPKEKISKELLFFVKSKPAWLLFLGVILGNTGLFCWLSYISPFMLKSTALSVKYLSLVMALSGIGMFLGNWISGKLTGRYFPMRVAIGVQVFGTAILALLFFFPSNYWVAAGLGFFCSGLMFALTVPEQMLMISAAPKGALLGSGIAQAGFFLGNTFGAIGGGIPLEAGMPYKYTALIGVVFSAIGLLFLLWYRKVSVNAKVLQ